MVRTSARSRALGAMAELGDTAEIEAALVAARTVPEAATRLGVPLRTLQHWIASYPKLKAAIVRGRAAHGLDARGYRKISPA